MASWSITEQGILRAVDDRTGDAFEIRPEGEAFAIEIYARSGGGGRRDETLHPNKAGAILSVMDRVRAPVRQPVAAAA